MGYEYIQEDNIENPLRYQYTAYRGADFLMDWYTSRKEILDHLSLDISKTNFEYGVQCNSGEDSRKECIQTKEIFQMLLSKLLNQGELSEEQKKILDGYVKTFEVRKRLYSCYSVQFKPENETDYHNMGLYTGFACICAAAFEQYSDLRYLNALLKVNDTLISQWERRSEFRKLENRERVTYALKKELDFVKKILQEKNVNWRGESA